MKLFISFSARPNGNCDNIAHFLSNEEDEIIYFRNNKYHPCVNCNYECFEDSCKYRNDDLYHMLEHMQEYKKIIFIVPMYCANPSSLYFIFNERCQDYFMHNEEKYENIIKRLFIIGIYGSKEESPDFIPCLEKWFNGSMYSNHVLGIERHKFDLKLKDHVLDKDEVKTKISEFINPTNAIEEISAMAVVLLENKILATKEIIYGKETLSLPKGHKENSELLIETAIRECFEETNIIINKDKLIKELESFSYEFLTPSNKLIRKTIVPFLFKTKSKGNPLPKEKRIKSVEWMDINEFLDNCTHENVKKVVRNVLILFNKAK